MKILIYGLHFKPDLIGIGKYTGEMTDWLHENGHNVTVITAPHFYPEWKLARRNWFYNKETQPYITWRCPIYVPQKLSGFARLLHSLSFVMSSFPMLIRYLMWKPDVIISIEPPFLTSPFALLYAKLTGTKSILHVQDLEIDAAYSLNILKKGYLFKIINKCEKCILSCFDIVSTISPNMKEQIYSKGVDHDDIYIFPNWANTEDINPHVDNKYMRNRFNIKSDQKVILYSGNIGEKQNLSLVMNVAEAMQSRSDYLFLLIGDGAAKQRLVEKVKRKNINNVKFYPLQPKKDFGALLTLADIHLITQDKNISDFVLPSKLTNILSAGGIAIISAKKETQLSNLIEEFQLGYMIEPESEIGLINALNDISSNEQMRIKISKNARLYAEKNLSKDRILSDYEKFILENI